MGFFILTLITAISNMDEDGKDFMIGYMLTTSMRRRKKMVSKKKVNSISFFFSKSLTFFFQKIN